MKAFFKDKIKDSPKYHLRTDPLDIFAPKKVIDMLKQYDFFDVNKNKSGKGIHHYYQTIVSKGEKPVIDFASGLIWQQSGSKESMFYTDAKKYIEQLNREQFAGYNTWRLPTLEEGMSLMEPSKKNKDLYIDPVFDSNQDWIWTADGYDKNASWIVSFSFGRCYYYGSRRDDAFFVRAVCS